MSSENIGYLIIAGANKAGTTSLFNYLSDHPEINPAFVKQTFFFLDKEWQNELGLKATYNYEEGLAKFDNYFQEGGTDRIRLEASPEYLFAPGVPDRLRRFLDEREGLVVILLRNPADRLRSLFFYGKQQGRIASSETFDDFLDRNVEVGELAYPSYMGRATGNYSSYVKRYIDTIGSDKLRIIFFEDLVRDPGAVLQELCEQVGIDPAFYQNYNFNVSNKTGHVRSRRFASAYNGLRGAAISVLHRSTFGRKIAGKLAHVAGNIYRGINRTAGSVNDEVISDDVMRSLNDEYASDIRLVEEYVGRKSPW